MSDRTATQSILYYHTIHLTVNKNFHAIHNITIFGMSKEHRIPLRKIRCMTKDCYKRLRKVWMAKGKPHLTISNKEMFWLLSYKI